MSGAGTPLVEVEGLTKHFPAGRRAFRGPRGWVRAVDGLSFELRRGETLGLVGESGCGKTTAALTLLRLLEPTAGTVRFDGRDVFSLEGAGLTAFRRRAQIVFQDPAGSLNPRMTVGAALREPIRAHGLAESPGEVDRRVAELLERVGLRPEHAGRYPHEFSGGQRQRIGIARALSVEPELLVCDEPVSALDVSVQAQILNLLADLQDELGLTYLFIAHDLAVVEHVSDRVAVMYLGRIMEIGDAGDVYRDPRHPYTRALLEAIPGGGGPVIAGARPGPGREPERGPLAPADVPSPVDPPPGCPFHPRCPHPRKDEACRGRVPPLEEKSRGRFAACIKEPPEGPAGP